MPEFSSRPSFAWGKSSSDVQPNKDQSINSTRKSEFPPLGSSAGPSSKSSLRKRSAYNNQLNQSNNIYPPRYTVLAQRQLSHEGAFIHPSLNEDQDRIDFQKDDLIMKDEGGNKDVSGIQQNGMSSVTVYDRSGKRISNGPDIYSRHAKRYIKGKQRQRMPDIHTGSGGEDVLTANNSLTDQTTFIMQEPIPPPFQLTKERVDLLITESQRAKRAKAARLRQSLDNQIEEGQDDPLLQQITRAFSSIENFKKAFAIQDRDKD